MKRFFKWLIKVILLAAVVLTLVHFRGPILKWVWSVLPLNQTVTTISEQFSETLTAKNTLIVYEVTLTGQETVTQDAALIGTVQKVTMPYTFTMSYSVDLDKAQLSSEENKIIVRVPKPTPGYQKLEVDEDSVTKTDWLYPLTTRRYAQIKQEVEDRLFAQCSENADYQAAAWNNTEESIRRMFDTIKQQNTLGFIFNLEILPLEEAAEVRE